MALAHNAIDGLCYDPGGGDPTFCARRCTLGADDCRMGYTCTDLGSGSAACLGA